VRRSQSSLVVERVNIMRVQHIHNVRVAIRSRLVSRRIGLQITERAGENIGFRLHPAQFVEDAEALLKHCFAAHREPVLRQIAQRHAFGARDRAVINGLDARQDFQQCGFTRAIAADEAGAFVRRDQPVDVFK
jgi:hypothetical protein